MIRQSCEVCEFFVPAQSCAERPAWGWCLKLVRGKAGATAGKAQPLFTWADSRCADLQMRESSALRSLGRE
jgi:hypothetical protein